MDGWRSEMKHTREQPVSSAIHTFPGCRIHIRFQQIVSDIHTLLSLHYGLPGCTDVHNMFVWLVPPGHTSCVFVKSQQMHSAMSPLILSIAVNVCCCQLYVCLCSLHFVLSFPICHSAWNPWFLDFFKVRIHLAFKSDPINLTLVQ